MKRLIDWFAEDSRRGLLAMLCASALMLVGLFACTTSMAADATVSWTHPTQRVDNTPLAVTDIKETQVEWGQCAAGNVFPATPAGMQPVLAPATTTTITGLGYGWWCFRASTVDMGGRESAASVTVAKQYLAPPKPPVLSSTITIVYEIAPHPVDGIRLARQVGTIPMGTECMDNPIQTDRGEYYEVSLDKVTLSRMPKSAIVVTQCGWKS